MKTYQNSPSENFASVKEEILHQTNFKIIIRFQQKDYSLIKIAKEDLDIISSKCGR